jgi:hypothetical protein
VKRGGKDVAGSSINGIDNLYPAIEIAYKPGYMPGVAVINNRTIWRRLGCIKRHDG